MTIDEGAITGLTSAQVSERIEDGRSNAAPEGTSRSVGQIVFANVFNPVNAIMLSLFVLILIAGYPQDGLFVGVVEAAAALPPDAIEGLLEVLAGLEGEDTGPRRGARSSDGPRTGRGRRR